MWAAIAPHLGAEYGVVGEGDWRVTADTTGDKRVRIAPGTAFGVGVFDTLDQEVTHTFDPISSGIRWDVLYARRSWSGGGGATTLYSAPATAAGNLPGTRVHNPGVLDDQPLALVQLTFGQTAPTQVVDLRVWQANGGATAAREQALQYLTAPGTEVWVGDTLWVRRVNASGVAEWLRDNTQAVRLFGRGEPLQGGTVDSSVKDFLIQSDAPSLTPGADGIVSVALPTPFPSGLFSVDVTLANGSAQAAAFVMYSAAAANTFYRPQRGRFSGRVLRPDGTPFTGQPFRIVYTAIGW
ncbi:hypothetical protein N866_07215 [Actinotalea ferrariae CF5-4]|uniref:Uncharacterized protein n=1 Tax=Actinotalea ferrariae CF5-4 TaxID=948458 RepID=A0A021VU48_9CELL|nr:hypothetical protein N866_07215 [Actinotalea ferrariae CF5-4]